MQLYGVHVFISRAHPANKSKLTFRRDYTFESFEERERFARACRAKGYAAEYMDIGIIVTADNAMYEIETDIAKVAT